ncbi:MAG: hypothetical protein JW860_15750 [Sedimentisphaerales bacterium]|nr:hypothetical protein [Sedimentisphaerales bacterium]
MVTFIYLILVVLILAAWWQVFAKAGVPGWAALIPIYNMYILLTIIGRPAWWLLLLFIPLVGFVICVVIYIDLAKKFDKGTGFAIGLLFLPFIFLPILAFSDAQYTG